MQSGDWRARVIFSRNMSQGSSVLNQEHFDSINWHDVKVYAIAFDDEQFKLFLDIDFILEWIEPQKPGSNYRFSVAPATLIFENVWNLSIEGVSDLNMILDNVIRSNPHEAKNANYIKEKTEYDWSVSLVSGEISFKSTGFSLYIRRLPILSEFQSVGLKSRGGISFDSGTIEK